jgi:asparagine synthase (glutamine-hydrolysing)
MCGFVGIFNRSGLHHNDFDSMNRMLDAIYHRGPDDYGIWKDNDSGVILGHRRLSIIDLSPLGRQPMSSESGRWVIAFNGEIYNYRELKSILSEEGCNINWKGGSDTEVLLALIEAYGFKSALEKCVGMFAIAAWDRKERQLFLARDRLGEKPLYYGKIGNSLVFGSDLNSFYKHKNWDGEIDRNSLALLMRHNYIPSPYSIFKNIFKVEAGAIVMFSNNSLDPIIEKYWNPSLIAAKKQSDLFSRSPDEAVSELEGMIINSLKGQMISDVPLGAFLSGGIDSSTIVALMQSMSSNPVKTFSIGFNQASWNEAENAKAVANHLGTDHTELYVSPEEAMNVIPNLSSIYSEPFSDSSQIPTFLVSKLASEKVTVCLSGDGGDELFSGYSRYSVCSGRNDDPVSRCLSKYMGMFIKSVPQDVINSLTSPFLKILPNSLQFKNIGRSAHKFAEILSLSNEDRYLNLISHWKNTKELVCNSTELDTKFTNLESDINFESFIRYMMFMDLVTYLPDDILVKVDRASMASSIEVRVPFLDHRLVEFSMSLPLSILRNNGKPKWPLRQILDKYVPKALTNRPKMGFGVPIGDWLRGPLKAWANDLLDVSRIKNEGYFDPDIVSNTWSSHKDHKENQEYRIWDILMFQSWLDRYKSR